MIELEDYLAIWKGLLFAAQILPGYLLLLKYAIPSRRCSTLILLPLILLIFSGGCAGLALLQRVTAPLSEVIVYNGPTAAGLILFVLILTLANRAIFDVQTDVLMYLTLNVAAYTLFLAAFHRMILLPLRYWTLMLSIYYYLTAFTLSHRLLICVTHRLIVPLLTVEPTRLRPWLFLFPASVCVLIALLLGFDARQGERGLLLALLFLVAALYLTILWVIKRISQSLAANQQFVMRMKQMEDFYVNLTADIQRNNAFRHDIRHHFILLQRMNRDGLNGEVDRYLTAYLKSMPSRAMLSYTGNYYVDALIFHFFQQAQSEGIHTISQLTLPSNIDVSPYDLCAIFGNCLENALEACRQQTQGYRFIRVQGETIQGRTVLIFSNSFNGHIYRSERLLSTKAGENRGYGIQNVEYAASRCGGRVKIAYTEHVFRISVLLNPSGRTGDTERK